MALDLPPLPYGYGALEPVLDAESLRRHHDILHRGHVENLNRALSAYPDLAAQPIEPILRKIEDVPEEIRPEIRYHGGGHANHQFFWKVIQPGGAPMPGGALADSVGKVFGGFDAFADRLIEAAAQQRGAGWVFLVTSPEGRGLEIVALANEDSVLPLGKPGLLAIDLWEHGWFQRYPGRRADYIRALLTVVNWTTVGARLDAIRTGDEKSLGGPAR